VGTSQAAKPGSHDRILDIAAARIRRDGIESLSVAELMAEAGLTHGAPWPRRRSASGPAAPSSSTAI
jgi:AcrR family transcriptional regulator